MPADLPTPIPIGGAHLVNPPRFSRWGLTDSRTSQLDQRDYSRQQLRCDLWLTEMESQTILRCRTDNVSDAGLHATAPIGFGLAVGQRYEARMAAGEPDLAPAGKHGPKSLGYATVIRTEMHVGDGMPDRIGFAMRFDVPQLIPRSLR